MSRRRRRTMGQSLVIEVVVIALLVGGPYLFLMSGAASESGFFIGERWHE